MSYHIIFAYPLDILRAWDVSVLPASTQTSKQSSRQAQNGSIVHCCWTDSRLLMSVLFPISGPQVTSCIWGADLACALQSKWPAWNPSWTWHGRHGRHGRRDYDPGSGDSVPQTVCVLKGAGSKWFAIGAVLPRSPNCLPVRFSIVSVWPQKKKQSMSPYVSLCGGFLHSLKILRGRLYPAPHQSVILILLISHVPARSALSHHKGQVASPEGRKWCRGCHVACSLEEYQTLEAAICSNHKGSHEA